MRARFGTIALLIFQAVWLNVILPGHTRGVIQLPGAAPAACHDAPTDGDSRCCHKPAGHGTDPSKSPADGGSGDPSSHCAVCFFAARLTPPPVIDFTPPALELLAVEPAPRAPAAVSADFIPTYYGRGPPAA